MIKVETIDFLNLIHGENAEINFRMIQEDKKPFNKHGTYKFLEKELIKCNKDNYDVYFVVNGGGTTKPEINRINAVYVDFDAGRDQSKITGYDKRGNPKHPYYTDMSIIEAFKKEKLNIISQFPVKPSIIVETRNGLHVYWLVHSDATISEFEECQLRFIQYFNSDDAIKSPERVMRLPNFLWCKKGYDKYLSKVIEFNNYRYNIQDIINSLPELNISGKEKRIKQEISVPQAPAIKVTSNIEKSNNIELIRKKDIDSLRKVLYNSSIDIDDNIGGVFARTIEEGILFSSFARVKTPYGSDGKIIVHNRERLNQLVKCNINLLDFLGFENSYFNCIFHADTTNSASVFKSPKTGQYIYKCHSSNCYFGSGNILKVVQRIQRCTLPQAYNFIKAIFDIELIETEWQKEQKELLIYNKDYLLSDDWAFEYPESYKLIKRYIPTLNILIDFAINNVQDIPYEDLDKSIFFISNRYLQHLLNVCNHEGVNKRINLLTFLKLLEKINSESLPKKVLNKAIHFAARKNQNNIVQFYSIPSYSDDLLSQVEEKAIIFKKNNLSMTGMSREMIERTFGKEQADKVYPQSTDKKISKVSNEFADNISQTIYDLIEEKGYALEKECLDIVGNTRQNHKRLKRVLPEIIINNDYQRIRLNGELKKKYNVKCEGYPFIIIKVD